MKQVGHDLTANWPKWPVKRVAIQGEFYCNLHFLIAGERSPSPAWKLTVRLKVLGRYILHKLQSIAGDKPTEVKVLVL